MSNRLKAEQFEQKQPPQRLDAIMEKSLANVCKDWMDDGKEKGDAIQWVARRFDPKGDLNLKQVATSIVKVDKDTQSESEHFFEAKQVYSVDAARLYMTSVAFGMIVEDGEHSEELKKVEAINALSFMMALTQYQHFVVWRMSYATEDHAETIIMGACLGHEGAIETGTHLTSCNPLPVLGCVLELMCTLGVLQYTADMV